MLYFFYTNTKPDAKIILNRGGLGFEKDISSDMISFNASVDINSITGNFMVVLDNTNDKHVDRFGNTSVEIGSSIEIFVLDNSALRSSGKAINSTTIFTKENDSIKQIIQRNYELDLLPFDTGKEFESYYEFDLYKLNESLNNYNVNDTLPSGLTIQLPPIVTAYKKIFLGIVLNVTQNFSAGTNMTITLTGESIGYWLRASTVNIHPSVQDPQVSNVTDNDLTPFANKYSELNALDVMKELIKGSTNNIVTIADFSFDQLGTSLEVENTKTGLSFALTDLSNEPMTDLNGNPLFLKDIYINHFGSNDIPTTIAGYMNKVPDIIESIYKNSQKVDGTFAKENSESKNENEWVLLSLQYVNAINILNDKKSKQALSKTDELRTQLNEEVSIAQQIVNDIKNSLEKNPAVKYQLELIQKIENKLSDKLASGQGDVSRALLKQNGIIDQWMEIFSKIILEVGNASYLRAVFPIKTALKSPDMMDGDYQDKATIAQLVSKNLYFEFYVDTNGHFVFKPPFYNIGIPDNDPTYILEEEDIQAFSITDTIDGIVTRVGVVGDTFHPVNLPRQQVYSLHSDLNLIRKYGVHHQELQSLLFVSDTVEAKRFGESYMSKTNQELVNANVTIMGRPDIRLGVACYLKPRDMFYYIKSISHDFQVGQGYTTTLNLIGGRRILTGVLVKSTIQTVFKQKIGDVEISEIDDDEDKEGNQIYHFITTTSNNSVQDTHFLNNDENNEFVDKSRFPTIIKNSFIIRNHPNSGFVGLIVPQGAGIISEINKNAFMYLWRIINQPSTYAKQFSQYGEQDGALNIIKNAFNSFIEKDKTIIPEMHGDIINNVSGFSQTKLDEFSLSFLEGIRQQIKSLQGNKSSSVKNNNLTQEDLTQAAIIYSQIINSIQEVGSYRQYTDENGREMPTTFDYGKQLIVETLSSDPQLNPFSEQSLANGSVVSEIEVNEIVNTVIKNDGGKHFSSFDSNGTNGSGFTGGNFNNKSISLKP